MQNHSSKAIVKNSFFKIDFSNYIRPDYIRRTSVESFQSVFSRYFEDSENRYNVTQSEISDISGIGNSLITKYKNGSRKPTLLSLIMLCIALRLTPDRSTYLLYTAGYTLNDSVEHRIYNLFLTGCAFNDYYSVENCHKNLMKYIDKDDLKEN